MAGELDENLYAPGGPTAEEAAAFREKLLSAPGKFLRFVTSAPEAPAAPSAPVPALPATPVGPADPSPEQLAAANAPAPETPVPAPVKAKGRTRAAAPAAVANSGADESAGLDLSPKAVQSDPVAASGVNPVVAAYLADRAARQGDLKAAQAEAARRGELAMAVGSLSGFGVKEGAGEAEARQAWANQPVTALEARQKAGDEALAEAGKLEEFKKTTEANDPKSESNAAMRQFYAQMGIKLPPNLTIAQAGPLADNFLKRQKDAEDNARALQVEREGRKSAEDIAAAHERGENYRAGLKVNAEKNEKPIAPAVAKPVEDAFNAVDALNDAQSKQGDVGVVTGLLGKAGIHVGAEGLYNDSIKAGSGSIAQTEYPGTRGPAGAKMIEKTAPSGLTPKDRADQQFNNMRKVALDRAETAVKRLEATQPNHPAVQEYRRRLDEYKAQSPGGGAKPSGRINGTLNGKPVNIDASRLAEAKARGFVPAS